MTEDRFDPLPIMRKPRDQRPVEAPRVAMPADTPTGRQLSNRNGALPMGGAGLPAVHRRLPDDAAVTVPPGVVIRVCPSADELMAARAAARPAQLVGKPLGMHAGWLVVRARKPGRGGSR